MKDIGFHYIPVFIAKKGYALTVVRIRTWFIDPNRAETFITPDMWRINTVIMRVQYLWTPPLQKGHESNEPGAYHVPSYAY